MSLSLEDWKKKKAKTLLKEPVTPALKQLDAAQKKLKSANTATGIDLKLLTDYGGAAKSAVVAIQKTIPLCKPRLHDTTKKLLQVMETEAKAAYAKAQEEQKNYLKFFKEFQGVRDTVIKALEAVEKSPTKQTVTKSMAVIKKANDFFQDAKKNYNSTEIEAGRTQIASANLILNEILKVHDSQPARVPGGRPLPATPDKYARQLGEVREKIAKLKTAGGFVNVQWTKKL